MERLFLLFIFPSRGLCPEPLPSYQTLLPGGLPFANCRQIDGVRLVKHSLTIILYLELYACCVEFIILMSDNLSSLYPYAKISLMGINMSTHQLFVVTTATVILPTVWLKDFSLLSYLSAGGVISSILVTICLFWVGVIDGVGFHSGRSGTALDFTNLPVAVGLYGFCYAGHSVFPNIYSSMRNRAQFPMVLIGSFIICTLLYAGVAVAGFLMFGESIASQFTLNMPHQFLASKFAAWTAVLSPLSKYALTMTPVALCIEELLPSSLSQTHFTAVLIRTVLVLSTLLIALVVPFFGFVSAFIGSFCAMFVALILPCTCYLVIQRKSVSLLEAIICVLIVILGGVCCCLGTYATIKKIAGSLG